VPSLQLFEGTAPYSFEVLAHLILYDPTRNKRLGRTSTLASEKQTAWSACTKTCNITI